MPDDLAAGTAVTTHAADTAAAQARAYHQRTKHQPQRYAAGPETLDWDAQPDPYRRYTGAVLEPLPLLPPGQASGVPWPALFQPRAATPFSRAALGALFELSLGLAAWKTQGPDRWAVRINPSSGNLHPTEAWLLLQGTPTPGEADPLPPGLYHYAPHEHALESRALLPPAPPGTPRQAWLGLSSIAWREAWKYGERAFRYVQLDTGHALGALRCAAALQGWELARPPQDDTALARLLGLDRDDSHGQAEREAPELLLQLRPAGTGGPAAPAPWQATARAAWAGVPNRLDRHPMYRWPVIEQVSAATALAEAAAPAGPAPAEPGGSAPAPAPVPMAVHATTPPTAPEPATPHAAPADTRPPADAAVLIRQRRSAQRFDARARLPLAALWPLLRALQPGHGLFQGMLPGAPAVQVLLFAHRVDGLATGAYLLPRGEGALARLRATLPATLDWASVPEAPADTPLWRLAANPALPGTLRTLNCHQALGSDALLAFALLADWRALRAPGEPTGGAAYRLRLQEAGLLGQALYLQAEAAGLRGTGIGCYFDDALHQLVGLAPHDAEHAAWQSVYHFTVGVPQADERVHTAPPYAHLGPRPGAPRNQATP